MVGLWVPAGCRGFFPEGLLGFFRKTLLGLLIPQPLALPLSGTTLGQAPQPSRGTRSQPPLSSLAPQLLLSIFRYLTPRGHFQALSLWSFQSPWGTRVWTQEACCLLPLTPFPWGGGWLPWVLAEPPARAGWAGPALSLYSYHFFSLVKSGTRRTGTGSVVTAALEVGTVSAGAGAEIGVTGTSAVPLGTGDVEGTKALGPVAEPSVSLGLRGSVYMLYGLL